MDNKIAEAVDALKPEKFANLSKVNIRAIQQVFLSDFELREVSHSLCGCRRLYRKHNSVAFIEPSIPSEGSRL